MVYALVYLFFMKDWVCTALQKAYKVSEKIWLSSLAHFEPVFLNLSHYSQKKKNKEKNGFYSLVYIFFMKDWVCVMLTVNTLFGVIRSYWVLVNVFLLVVWSKWP